MSKSYIFTLNKYYNDEELENVSPIIENYVNLFADDNGTATLQIKSDVSIVVKRDEGLVLHMVLDNPDNFTALPKKLSKAKQFLQVFITKMAEAVDEQAKKNTAIAGAKAKVESDAEDTLLDYINGGDKTEDEPETKETVTVNGKEVTDPAEKEKVIAEMKAKKKEIVDRANKMFNDTFDKVMKSLEETGIDWLSDYLN